MFALFVEYFCVHYIYLFIAAVWKSGGIGGISFSSWNYSHLWWENNLMWQRILHCA